MLESPLHPRHIDRNQHGGTMQPLVVRVREPLVPTVFWVREGVDFLGFILTVRGLGIENVPLPRPRGHRRSWGAP